MIGRSTLNQRSRHRYSMIPRLSRKIQKSRKCSLWSKSWYRRTAMEEPKFLHQLPSKMNHLNCLSLVHRNPRTKHMMCQFKDQWSSNMNLMSPGNHMASLKLLTQNRLTNYHRRMLQHSLINFLRRQKTDLGSHTLNSPEPHLKKMHHPVRLDTFCHQATPQASLMQSRLLTPPTNGKPMIHTKPSKTSSIHPSP